MNEDELTPEALLAQATKARGDIFPEWKPLVRRASAFADHCLLAGGATDELLGPGPRELIAIAALCMRGEVELAAQHMRRAYDYGMTRRNVLEAICCVLPMSGMITGQVGFRAMKIADSAALVKE